MKKTHCIFLMPCCYYAFWNDVFGKVQFSCSCVPNCKVNPSYFLKYCGWCLVVFLCFLFLSVFSIFLPCFWFCCWTLTKDYEIFHSFSFPSPRCPVLLLSQSITEIMHLMFFNSVSVLFILFVLLIFTPIINKIIFRYFTQKAYSLQS